MNYDVCAHILSGLYWSTQREYLPQKDSVGPHVALRAVDVLEDAFWSHPLQGQKTLETRNISFNLGFSVCLGLMLSAHIGHQRFSSRFY